MLAGVGAVDLVLGAHDRSRAPVLHGGLEGGEVDLAQRALVDVLVDGVAVDLLVVGDVVLGLGDRALRLRAAHRADRDLPRELRVLAVGLERAPVEGDARDVDVGALLEVAADRARLAPHHGAVAEGDAGVERRSQAQGGGQRRRLRLHRPARADAGRAVVEPQRGNAQPRDGERLARVGAVGDGVQHRQLLVERHLAHQRVRAGVGRSVRIHPRRAGAPTLARATRSRRSEQQENDHTQHRRHQRLPRAPHVLPLPRIRACATSGGSSADALNVSVQI